MNHIVLKRTVRNVSEKKRTDNAYYELGFDFAFTLPKIIDNYFLRLGWGLKRINHISRKDHNKPNEHIQRDEGDSFKIRRSYSDREGDIGILYYNHSHDYHVSLSYLLTSTYDVSRATEGAAAASPHNFYYGRGGRLRLGKLWHFGPIHAFGVELIVFSCDTSLLYS